MSGDGTADRAMARARQAFLEEKRLQERLAAGLSPEDSKLREKVLLAVERYGGQAIGDYREKEGQGHDKWAPFPGTREELAAAVELMASITEKAKLKRISGLLTPFELEKFLPIYVKFKQEGKFSRYWVS